jgi:hypothetical protein
MIARTGKRGRPPKFVYDESGKPIVGLSYDKINKSYYATYSNPRIYFGSDYPTALLEFRKYENSLAKEEPYVEIHLPPPPDVKGTQIIKWTDLCNDPPIVGQAYPGDILTIPESLFLEAARTLILRDPIDAARKLGIPELCRLQDLPKLEPALSLARILEFYLKRHSTETKEDRLAKASWKIFCQIVNATTIRDITSNMVHDYYDTIIGEYRAKNWSITWLKGRFSRVKTILNHTTVPLMF